MTIEQEYPMTYEEMRTALVASGNYKVQKKYKYSDKKNGVYNTPDPSTKLYIGTVIDTETTGLNPKTDEVFNIGLVQFTYDDTGKIYRVTNSYNGFQEPNSSIPAEIVKLTNISDSMVANKKFNMELITSIINESDILIAHKADFDYGFVEKIIPEVKDKLWCDTLTQIPWVDFNVKVVKLFGIALHFDFFFKEHSALSDCQAVVEILSRQVDGKWLLKYLLETLDRPLFKIKAIGFPIGQNDSLKARNYTFDGNSLPKHWSKTSPDLAIIKEEKDFLSSYRCQPEVETIDRIKLFKS